MHRLFIVALLLTIAAPAPAAEPLKLPITRDTWLSAVGDEANGSNGGSPRLKVKSIQELTLLDFDPAPLRGRIVTRATLHLKSASPPDVLKRVTVSTISAEWAEGKSTSYKPEAGSSSFNHRKHPDVPWGSPGDAITDVTLGRGGSIWRMADATPPDANGWQTVAVEPAIIMARAAGVSFGLLVYDDTGSEWTRDGEKFTYKLFPNRYLFSRDQNAASAPYLTVELGDEDKSAPESPAEVKETNATDRRPPVGESLDISWSTPADVGSGVVGFRVEIDGKPVPRHLIPAPGGSVRMRLRPGDIALSPQFTLTVKAVDGAGNESKPLELRRTFPGWSMPYAWTTDSPKTANGESQLRKLGNAVVSVLDPLDKIHPVSLAMTPPQAVNYPQTNHLWSQGTIHLSAARNEFIGFQLAFTGAVEGVTAEFTTDAKEVSASMFRYVHVPTAKGPMPDPLVPLEGPFAVPTPSEKITGQKSGSLLVEVYVGHGTSPGQHKGTLKLRTSEHSLDLPVELTVHSFALPDRLSFIPEMNCYGLPSDEREYYRLAHRNRTVINRVPYSQRGEVFDGCAPKGFAPAFDWSAWDARFGPLFDGSAFTDLPRKNVPLELFYLPLHENWPTPMNGNYNGNYWADAAFPPAYRNAFSTASLAFAMHFAARGWTNTLFQGFLNNKVDFKKNGWSRGSSPWLLDEPANWHDYWALKWYGEAFHEGVRAAGQGKPKMLYRADISRPEWQRDALDAVLDYNVVAGSAFYKFHRTVLDRRDRFGQFVLVYGGSNAVETSNMQPAGWCLDTWSLGADGVIPWQTIGTKESWNKADDLSLFYPARPGEKGPIPSIRLKAYLRGQQDVEYLALLEASTGQSRSAIGEAVRAFLKLQPVWEGSGRTGVEDAGVIQYANLKPQDLWALRVHVAAELNKLFVKPATPLTATAIPRREFGLASPGMVTGSGK